MSPGRRARATLREPQTHYSLLAAGPPHCRPLSSLPLMHQGPQEAGPAVRHLGLAPASAPRERDRPGSRPRSLAGLVLAVTQQSRAQAAGRWPVQEGGGQQRPESRKFLGAQRAPPARTNWLPRCCPDLVTLGSRPHSKPSAFQVAAHSAIPSILHDCPLLS